MLHKIFKYKSGIGLSTIIVLVLGGLGWYIKVTTKEAVVPISHEMTIFFKNVDHQFGAMSEKIVQIDEKYNALDSRVTKGFQYQNEVIRPELKEVAETKLDKVDYHTDVKSIDDRFDALEIADQIHNINHENVTPKK